MKFKYPRVSEILEPYSNMSLANVPKEYLKNAATRGTILHSYCTAYARGDFIPHLNEEYTPYYNSFVQWYDENVDNLIFSETRLYHDELQYCGQPDLIVKLKNGEQILIDIKSSYKIYQTHPVQLAAYLDLANINNLGCFKGIILKLSKEGKVAKAYDYGMCEPYYKVFLRAVHLYDYFLRKKTPKKRGSK